jgi:Phage related hypothetical protein (DUF1799)
MGVPAGQLLAAAKAEHAGAGSAGGVVDAGVAANGDVLVPGHLWGVVRLFEALCTQWRVVASMAGQRYIGLDYNTLDVAVRWLGLDAAQPDGAGIDKPQMWTRLQTMERCALRVLNGVADSDDDLLS